MKRNKNIFYPRFFSQKNFFFFFNFSTLNIIKILYHSVFHLNLLSFNIISKNKKVLKI